MSTMADSLREIPLFADLSKRDLKKLGESMHEKSFVPGQGVPDVPRVHGTEVIGPYEPTGIAGTTASRERIFICRPERAADESACAERILTNLARQAYRRPVDDADLGPLLAFYRRGAESGGFLSMTPLARWPPLPPSTGGKSHENSTSPPGDGIAPRNCGRPASTASSGRARSSPGTRTTTSRTSSPRPPTRRCRWWRTTASLRARSPTS